MNGVRLKISSVESAASSRKPGYLQDVLKSGLISGEWIELSAEDFDRIRETYSTGLGDIVKRVAQPIARGIDAVLGTDLKNCNSCESRRVAMNKAGRSIGIGI
jgi:hypothetical protein